MSDSWSDEHISAWLDDELSPAQREAFERHLGENPHDAERVQEFQSLREQLRALPRRELEEGFAGRVLKAIERSAATPALAASADVASLESPVEPVARSRSARPVTLNWQVAGATISGLAALLLLAMFLAPQPTSTLTDNRLTSQERSAPPSLESAAPGGPESAGGEEIQRKSGDNVRAQAGEFNEESEEGRSGRQDEAEAAMPAPEASVRVPDARVPDADAGDLSAMESYSDSDASRGAPTPDTPADDKNREMLDELVDTTDSDHSELRDMTSTPEEPAGDVMEKEGKDADSKSESDAEEPGLIELEETRRGMANSLNQPNAADVEMREFAGYAFDEIVVVSTQSKQLQWLEPEAAADSPVRQLEEQNEGPAPPNPGGFSMKRDNSFGSDDQPVDDESAGNSEQRQRRRSMNRPGSPVPQPTPVPLRGLMFVTVDATEAELQAIIERMEGTPLTLGQGQLIDMMNRLEQSGGGGRAGGAGGGGFGGGSSGQRQTYRGRAESEPQMRMQRMLPSQRAEVPVEQETPPSREDAGDGQPDMGRGGGVPAQGQPSTEPQGGQAPNANRGQDTGMQDLQSGAQANQYGQTPEVQTRRRYLLVIQRLPAETTPVPPAAQDR